MINIQNVNKYFGNFQALSNISFDIKKGEIVGFLGPNGAGKTTLMRILTLYFPASSGKILISGIESRKNPITIKRIIGYLPENPPLYQNMTVEKYLKFSAQIKDIPVKDTKKQIDKVLEECELLEVKDKTILTLSKGYKQRVGIAQAIINDPQVLILDEPTNGLDPIQILQVRKLIKNLEYKRTVIISTHILSEIEQIANRVLIIKGGLILADDSLTNLVGPEKEKTNDQQTTKITLEEAFLRITKEKI